MKSIKKRSFCGISSSLDIFGDRWSLLIIRDMLFYDKHTYSDFLNSDEKIATNILADRLIILESAGIITKEVHPDSKAKYFYELTSKGIELMPVLLELLLWSDKYLDISDRAKKAAKAYNQDKIYFIERIKRNLKTKQYKFMVRAGSNGISGE
jgi:DNA-binding HxlR family transcriptional regulator